MGSLRDELAQEPSTSRSGACVTCAFIATFPPDEQAEWHELLSRDSGESTERLFRFAKHKNFLFGITTFRRHRVEHEVRASVAH